MNKYYQKAIISIEKEQFEDCIDYISLFFKSNDDLEKIVKFMLLEFNVLLVEQNFIFILVY